MKNYLYILIFILFSSLVMANSGYFCKDSTCSDILNEYTLSGINYAGNYRDITIDNYARGLGHYSWSEQNRFTPLIADFNGDGHQEIFNILSYYPEAQLSYLTYIPNRGFEYSGKINIWWSLDTPYTGVPFFNLTNISSMPSAAPSVIYKKNMSYLIYPADSAIYILNLSTGSLLTTLVDKYNFSSSTIAPMTDFGCDQNNYCWGFFNNSNYLRFHVDNGFNIILDDFVSDGNTFCIDNECARGDGQNTPILDIDGSRNPYNYYPNRLQLSAQYLDVSGYGAADYVSLCNIKQGNNRSDKLSCSVYSTTGLVYQNNYSVWGVQQPSNACDLLNLSGTLSYCQGFPTGQGVCLSGSDQYYCSAGNIIDTIKTSEPGVHYYYCWLDGSGESTSFRTCSEGCGNGFCQEEHEYLLSRVIGQTIGFYNLGTTTTPYYVWVNFNQIKRSDNESSSSSKYYTQTMGNVYDPYHNNFNLRFSAINNSPCNNLSASMFGNLSATTNQNYINYTCDSYNSTLPISLPAIADFNLDGMNDLCYIQNNYASETSRLLCYDINSTSVTLIINYSIDVNTLYNDKFIWSFGLMKARSSDTEMSIFYKDGLIHVNGISTEIIWNNSQIVSSNSFPGDYKSMTSEYLSLTPTIQIMPGYDPVIAGYNPMYYLDNTYTMVGLENEGMDFYKSLSSYFEIPHSYAIFNPYQHITPTACDYTNLSGFHAGWVNNCTAIPENTICSDANNREYCSTGDMIYSDFTFNPGVYQYRCWNGSYATLDDTEYCAFGCSDGACYTPTECEQANLIGPYAGQVDSCTVVESQGGSARFCEPTYLIDNECQYTKQYYCEYEGYYYTQTLFQLTLIGDTIAYVCIKDNTVRAATMDTCSLGCNVYNGQCREDLLVSYGEGPLVYYTPCEYLNSSAFYFEGAVSECSFVTGAHTCSALWNEGLDYGFCNSTTELISCDESGYYYDLFMHNFTTNIEVDMGEGGMLAPGQYYFCWDMPNGWIGGTKSTICPEFCANGRCVTAAEYYSNMEKCENNSIYRYNDGWKLIQECGVKTCIKYSDTFASCDIAVSCTVNSDCPNGFECIDRKCSNRQVSDISRSEDSFTDGINILFQGLGWLKFIIAIIVIIVADIYIAGLTKGNGIAIFITTLLMAILTSIIGLLSIWIVLLIVIANLLIIVAGKSLTD